VVASLITTAEVTLPGKGVERTTFPENLTEQVNLNVVGKKITDTGLGNNYLSPIRTFDFFS